jgi:hypothetical protein
MQELPLLRARSSPESELLEIDASVHMLTCLLDAVPDGFIQVAGGAPRLKVVPHSNEALGGAPAANRLSSEPVPPPKHDSPTPTQLQLLRFEQHPQPSSPASAEEPSLSPPTQMASAGEHHFVFDPTRVALSHEASVTPPPGAAPAGAASAGGVERGTDGGSGASGGMGWSGGCGGCGGCGGSGGAVGEGAALGRVRRSTEIRLNTGRRYRRGIPKWEVRPHPGAGEGHPPVSVFDPTTPPVSVFNLTTRDVMVLQAAAAALSQPAQQPSAPAAAVSTASPASAASASAAGSAPSRAAAAPPAPSATPPADYNSNHSNSATKRPASTPAAANPATAKPTVRAEVRVGVAVHGLSLAFHGAVAVECARAKP